MGNNISCCDEKELVQDKICSDWTIAGTEIIYIDNVSALVSSGYVKLNSAPAAADTIAVNFLLGAATVATLPAIGVSSAAAFTVGKFDEIQIVPSGAGTFIGEFCITPRYLI
ncbi:DUF3992 domain-containing protein [Bacillus benzoevorans]|uniref:Endospore appendages core domain-containing protein n=1 Tax=Bacillus benzoevorans TaxID=1456 RepID=A0A7X0HRC3_9BACI|nr:S-Ena type endospore appendage [Bacillus benzoevorans]MBB6445474.1 hypothetical protein [Bacillus benzoevorans]